MIFVILTVIYTLELKSVIPQTFSTLIFRALILIYFVLYTLKLFTKINRNNLINYVCVLLTASLITITVLIIDFPLLHTFDELWRLSFAKNIFSITNRVWS